MPGTPATGIQVIVPEVLRRPDKGWPAFPSADDVAKGVLWSVRVTIDLVRQAAAAAA